MDTATLVAGKGKRVELTMADGTIVTGKLMAQQRNAQYIAFYVKIDGNEKRSLVPMRYITRFL